MANTPTYIYYEGNGSQTDFNFPFPYLSPTHVKALVNGVETPVTLLSASVVRFAVAPGTGLTIRVYRETPRTPIVTWADGMVILGRHLNASNLQSIYIAEEARDYALSLAEEAKQFALNELSDTANVVFTAKAIELEASVTIYRDQAASSASAAAVSAAAALASENNLGQSEANAAASAAAAAVSEGNAAASASTAVTKASEASSDASLAVTAKTDAESAKGLAEAAKTAAETASSTATTAKTDAEAAKTAAETAKTSAETAQSLAEAAKTDAETAKTAAETAKTLSDASALKASKWADEATDTEVEPGRYSAKHWADKAADTVNFDANDYLSKATYDPQAIGGDAFARSNHTGTQPVSSVSGLSTTLTDLGDRVTTLEGAPAPFEPTFTDYGSTGTVGGTDNPTLDLGENLALGQIVVFSTGSQSAWRSEISRDGGSTWVELTNATSSYSRAPVVSLWPTHVMPDDWGLPETPTVAPNGVGNTLIRINKNGASGNCNLSVYRVL